MATDSIFWIASMTKPVTSVAAMMLVEEGKLDLDAPVPQYLPELGEMQVAEEQIDPATGKVTLQLVPQNRLMTVLDLLRHTSGLVYPPQFRDTEIHKLYRKAVFARDKTLADFVASLGALSLAHQPGEVWEYSWSADVLARVVEVASRQSFDQFLQGRIFGPLQMIDTGFHVPETKLTRLVAPPPGGRLAVWDVTKAPALFSGGGGLVSTVRDYLQFCRMLLKNGELNGVRILSPQTVKRMTSNALPADIRFANEMIGPALGATWGLGFAITTDPARFPGSIGSVSWSGVWGTFFWIDFTENIIRLQLTQVSPPIALSNRNPLRVLTYEALNNQPLLRCKILLNFRTTPGCPFTTLLGHSASHSERLFLPLKRPSRRSIRTAQSGGNPRFVPAP
jgi:CubicO group peptidase (beta-lactamase class C family)